MSMDYKVAVAVIALLLSLGLSGAAQAETQWVDSVTYVNPLHVTIRDPFILEHDGLYYLYGTTSSESGFMAFASGDLVHWTGPLTVYRKPTDATWNVQSFWAPEVHHYGDRFYMYYTAADSQDRPAIGVAVSKSPLGPFVDAATKPITPAGWETLDAHVFVDDDGQSYLLYSHSWTQVGAGSIYIQALADDLLSLIGEPKLLASAADQWWTRGTLGRVLEAPTVIKHGGKYYLMYSSFATDEYGVGYAVADHLYGPYEHKERILFNDSGHNSVFVGPDGLYYTAYHAPNGRAPYRLYIDQLDIDQDGVLTVYQTEGEEIVIRSPWPLKRLP